MDKFMSSMFNYYVVQKLSTVCFIQLSSVQIFSPASISTSAFKLLKLLNFAIFIAGEHVCWIVLLSIRNRIVTFYSSSFFPVFLAHTRM